MESQKEPTARVRTTVFPTPIVDNAQDFTYNPRFGAIARRGALGRGAPRPGRSAPSGKGNNNNQASSSTASVQTPLTARPNITRSIYILPASTTWIEKTGDTLPFVESWPLDSPSVLVSLPSTTKWEGLVHPFPTDSAEHGIALAFAKAFGQPTTHAYSGLFYKRTKKRKGSGTERGYYLEPYFRVKGAFFGSLATNTNLVYCPDSTILPQGGVDTYMTYIRRSEGGPGTTTKNIPLILHIDPPTFAAPQQILNPPPAATQQAPNPPLAATQQTPNPTPLQQSR